MTKQRTKPGLPSLDGSLDLSFPSTDLDKALALLAPLPSKAPFDVCIHGQILIWDLETVNQMLFPTRGKIESTFM